MTELPSAGNGLLNRRRLLQMGSTVGLWPNPDVGSYYGNDCLHRKLTLYRTRVSGKKVPIAVRCVNALDFRCESNWYANH
jgi:hypothetical protein